MNRWYTRTSIISQQGLAFLWKYGYK